jgi:hypothetical protein
LQSLPEFLLDSAFAFPQASRWRLVWEWERFFSVLLLFPALGLEMEWAWIFWLAVSDVFALESALALL